jgi:translation initiation factor 5B
MVGRQINEGDVLYVDVPVQHARVLSSKFRDYLTPGELALLSEMVGLASSGQSTTVA